MELYLIRHTTPLVDKGICYGQADLDVTDTFLEEVKNIVPHLPGHIDNIYSSPLQRCRKLAIALFKNKAIEFHDDLMELNCGDWELKVWNEIPKPEIQPWLDDFVQIPVPNGESYLQMHSRVINRFHQIKNIGKPAAVVAHGGVLRSILAHVTNTPLKESFDLFKCHYGSVVKITEIANVYSYEMLYNVSLAGKEWHRPEF